MSIKKVIKTVLTRTLSFTLALAMTITPLTYTNNEHIVAHATNTGNQAENTGGGSTNMSGSSSALAWSSNAQGYRFYVINANLERISPTYDFLFSTPTGVREKLYTTRFDTTNSPGEHFVHTISDLIAWCESNRAVPTPTKLTGSGRVGNGAEFKEWFFNGQGGSTITGGGAGAGHTHKDTDGDHLCDIGGCNAYTNNSYCSHVDMNNDGTCERCNQIVPSGFFCICGNRPCTCLVRCDECYALLNECLWGGNHSCIRCPAPPCRHLDREKCDICDVVFSPTYEGCACCGTCKNFPCTCYSGDVCGDCNKPMSECTCSKLNFSTQPSSSSPAVQAYIDRIIAKANTYKYHQDLSDRKAVKKAYDHIYSDDLKAGITGGDDWNGNGMNRDKVQADIDIYEAYSIIKECLQEKGFFGNLIDKWFGYNYSYNEDLLKQNIPLSGGGGGEGMPAYNLVNKDNTMKVTGYTHVGAALEDGCYLIVEPITWLNIRRNTGSWSSESTYNPYKSYGTWWNLASNWVGKTQGSFYSSVMSILFVNCLATSKDVVTETGKIVTAPSDANSQKDVSVALPLTNSFVGLSMHMYDSSDFAGTGLYENNSQTSTYDEPIGRDPGPAPDDSNKLSEDSKTDDTKHANIVKFYEDKGSGDKFSYTRTPTPKTIKVESEPPTGYVVKDWYTSSTFKSASGSSPTYLDYKNSMGKNQQGTQPKTVELGENETTLYVLLVKSSTVSQSDYTLYESEISKPITMGSDLSDVQIPMPMFSLKDECDGHCSHTIDNCNSCDWEWDCDHSCGTRCTEAGSCQHNCGDGCKDYYCAHKRSGCSGSSGCLRECTWELVDKSLHFKFKNLRLNNYPKLIKHSGSGFVPSLTEVSETRTNLDEHIMNISGFDYKFVIYRGDDELNYAKYKYDQSTLGFSPKSIKTTKTRKSSDYTKGIVMDFADDGCDLTTTSRGKINGTVYCTDEEVITLPNPTLTHQVNILIQAYSGVERTPDANINLNPRMNIGSSGNLLMMGRMISTNTSVKFNPYIQMTWAGMSGSKTKVQVLSEYRREILPNDYAEISWTQSNGNLLVQSQMWAMDSNLTSITDSNEWTGINQVLKGGASLQLTDKGAQKVTVSTYQTIIEDTSRDISEITGTYQLTKAEAETYHRNFVEEAKQTLDKAELIQWVSTTNDGTMAWEDGSTVQRGGDISFLSNGSNGTASTESKYYLEKDINDNSNSQRNDLDIKEKGTKKLSYRFYSDVEGNIYMKKTGTDGSVTTTKILNKKQGVEALSGEASSVNSRTYAVQKLLAALERNSGHDTTASWASDGKWYNEAYAGVTVYIQHTDIEVGLSAGVNPLRTMVLDPKLIPKVDSKNNQGTTAFSSAFKVNLDQNTPIAKFKGTDIFMASPDMLFNSRNIYITNMTVQDNR